MLDDFVDNLDSSCYKGDGDFEEVKKLCKDYLRERRITTVSQLLSCAQATPHEWEKSIEWGNFVTKCSEWSISWISVWSSLRLIGRADGFLENILNGAIIDLRRDGTNKLESIKKRHIDGCHSAELRGSGDVSLMGNSSIVVVRGPCGSGKTFFATKECPRYNLKEGSNLCTLYVELYPYFRWKELEEAILYGMKTFVRQATKIAGWFSIKQRPLEMRLALVIDEAHFGCEQIQNRDFLRSILKFIGDLATDTMLVISGTGVDQFWTCFPDEHDVHKFDMMPWGESEVSKLGRQLELSDTEVAVVQRQVALSALLSNARLAYFLLQEWKKSSFRAFHLKDLQKENDPDSERKVQEALDMHVPILLDSVMRKYIGHKPLGSLCANRRRLVAAAILEELYVSARSPHLARWPTFDLLHRLTPARVDLNMEHLAQVAFALIDIHVEKHRKEDDKHALRFKIESSQPYPVSITPAVCMILYHMLGVRSSIYSGRSNYGLTAMYALRQELLSATSPHDLIKWKLMESGEPFPATESWKTVMVPLHGNFTIWRNGDEAPFADLIAPYKLYRLKFSTTVPREVAIDLFEEGGKMGLLLARSNNEKNADVMSNEDYFHFHKGEVLLSALHQHWDSTPAKDIFEDSEEQDAHNARSGLYPESLLFRRQKLPHQVKVLKLELDMDGKKPNENDVAFLERYRNVQKNWRDVNTTKAKGGFVPIVANFYGSHPMRVIFVTNATRIHLKFGKERKTVVTRNDVDNDGYLKKSVSSSGDKTQKVTEGDVSTVFPSFSSFSSSSSSSLWCAGTWLEIIQKEYFKAGLEIQFLFVEN